MYASPERQESSREMRAGLPAPVGMEDTGLPQTFLLDLALKTLFHGGQLQLWQLSAQTKLPIAVLEALLSFMRSERLLEVARRGAGEGDISYQLSEVGRARAEAAIQKCHYVGPAPVSLEAYVAQVERQSVVKAPVLRAAMQVAFANVVLGEGLLDQFGAAMNSGKAMLIYGPSGSGKTYISEHLARVLSGLVYVPYAILVDGQVIQVFDPLVHRVAKEGGSANGLDRCYGTDSRWQLCHRPVVMTGGELTLATLDMQFDARSRFYVAPPQVKANNGLFVIDDLGRQLVTPQDLMNRWIVPLDRSIDHYTLHTGMKFCLPFDVKVVFSTNLQPAELADEAFLRRLGYKIFVGPVGVDDYRGIFVQACERAAVRYSERAFDHLVRQCHGAEGRPMVACTPYDIVSKLRDRAAYEGLPAGELIDPTDEALSWAWRRYFAEA